MSLHDHADLVSGLIEHRGNAVLRSIFDCAQFRCTNALGGNATEIGFRNKAVFPISLDKSINQEVVEYLKGSLFWHIDGTMNDVPVRGSILTSKVLPTWGGNTEFANCYAAYDDLPDETKARIDGLRVVHTMWASQLYHTPEPTLKQLTDWQSRGHLRLWPPPVR